MIMKDVAHECQRAGALLPYFFVSRAFSAAASLELYRDVEVIVCGPHSIPGKTGHNPPALVRPITEDIGSRVRNLLRTLRTNADLASLVKSLKITTRYGDDERNPVFILAEILRSCANINSLYIDDLDGDGLVFPCLDVIRLPHPTLSRLKINSCLRPGAEVERALSGLRAIKHLHLELYGDEREDADEADRAALSLTSLVLEADEDGISNGIFVATALSSAESLETLVTDLQHFPFDLSPFSRLRTLTLCKIMPDEDWYDYGTAKLDSEEEEDSKDPLRYNPLADGCISYLVTTLRSANPCLQHLTLIPANNELIHKNNAFLLHLPRSLRSLNIALFLSNPILLLSLLQPAVTPHLVQLVINGLDTLWRPVNLDDVVAAGEKRGIRVVVEVRQGPRGCRWGVLKKTG